MKIPRHDEEKIRSILKRAYHEKAPCEIDSHWETRLMARIREIGPLASRPNFLPVFERVVWRLIPVTTSLALGMIVLLIKLYLNTTPDAFQLFLQGVQQQSLAQIFLG